MAVTLAGCARVAPAIATPAKAKTTAALAGPEIKLYPIDKVGFDALLVHHPGKVILVDFWATWCPKCREDFAQTVGFDRKYGPEGLVVISFACDTAEKTDEIVEFLREHDATFKNLRAADDLDRTFDDFEITGGALPHYKLYDKKGKLWKTFAVDPDAERQFSLEDIDAAVQELLAESQKPAETTAPAAVEKTDPAEKASATEEKQSAESERVDR
jgi:thiol-disulfide isomerase/thioredoxin